MFQCKSSTDCYKPLPCLFEFRLRVLSFYCQLVKNSSFPIKINYVKNYTMLSFMETWQRQILLVFRFCNYENWLTLKVSVHFFQVAFFILVTVNITCISYAGASSYNDRKILIANFFLPVLLRYN